jgi:hypothetical protein
VPASLVEPASEVEPASLVEPASEVEPASLVEPASEVEPASGFPEGCVDAPVSIDPPQAAARASAHKAANRIARRG